MNAELRVTLDSVSYPISFLQDGANQLASAVRGILGERRKSAVLTDDGVASAQARLLDVAFAGVPRIVIRAGEQSKSLGELGRVLDFLAECQLGRDGVLWVVGGGVPGDLGGFAAATYLRGIRYIQVPTTLLAMVDSSVGGKTGINLTAGKNLAGSFHHPIAVYVLTEVLRTLPKREFAAGMAEVLKYGLLGDADLFALAERGELSADHPAMSDVIRRCCGMKAAIVRADERETVPEGGRALLNLGHTFGHAIEQATGYREYLHGEAVAVGLAAAARLSKHLGHLCPEDTGRVDRALAAQALPARLLKPLPVSQLMQAMQHDKKVRAGRLRFVVLRRLGEASTQSDIDSTLVETVWRETGAI